MKFENPEWIYAGAIAVALLAALMWRAQKERRRKLVQLVAADLVEPLTAGVSTVARYFKQALVLAAAGLFFVALARPQYGYEWREVSSTGTDILIAVDTSKSMLTPDVKPDRLTRAKLAVADLAAMGADARLGLIAFAGSSFLQCPLTTDMDVFLETLQALDTRIIPTGGTDIASAIHEAIRALSSNAREHRMLVLITDGEDLSGTALEAARTAAKEGIKIYTVGVGTAEGELIPVTQEDGQKEYIKDENGKPVKSRLDERMLRQIAEITGGKYALLEGNENGLQKLWQSDWRTRPGRKADSREARIPLEQFQWPLGCAIGLLILEYLIPDKKRQQTVTKKNRQTRSAAAPVLTAPALCIAIAGLWLSSVSNAAAANGWELYQKQQYQQAGEAYKAGAKNNPEIPEWLFNAGAAAFKAGQYNEAVELFTQTLLKADPRLQQNAYYNLGNSRYRLGQQTEQTDPPKTISAWKSAVQDYENALKLVPEDADAKYNLELVKKKLEELQKKQQQNQNSAQNQDKQQQEQKNPDSKKNNKQNSSSGQNESNKNDAKDSSGKKNSKKDKDESPAREQPQNNENTGTLDKVDVSSGASQNPTEKKQPGQMGKEEANALLDAVKGDEKNLPIEILKSENAAQNRQDGKVRDW